MSPKYYILKSSTTADTILAIYFHWGRCFVGLHPEFWSFYKHDWEVQETIEHIPTGKVAVYVTGAVQFLKKMWPVESLMKFYCISGLLRCQFVFWKQCSEASFTCHINAIFLRRGTKVVLCFSKLDLMLAYFTAERFHCVPVHSKMDCRVLCSIEIICFWSNTKAFHSLQHHPSSFMEQHKNLNKLSCKEDYFFLI